MAACAVATRCLSSSAMPPEAEGEGVEPPRSCDPAVFETAYRARGSPSVSGPDRSRTCTSPGKSRELSVELRSQDVVGRDRTCDAPRFRRALYRLSFDHVGWARLDSNQQPLVCKTSALSIELLAHEYRGRESNPHGRGPRRSRRRASAVPPPRSDSGTRDRTSISTFRAWCPAG